MRACPVLWLIVPCYNEQEVLPVTAPLFLEKLKGLITSGKISDSSRILFINDGSCDDTWEIIKSFVSQDNHFSGISLNRNRGQQNALLAGLMEAKDKCEITISLDCDGQHDPDAIDDMLSEYASGSEVVYGVRNDREAETWLKGKITQFFYRLIRSMGAEVIYNHFEYRLISSRVLKHLAEFKEVNIFLRGIIPLVGFKSSCVMYKCNRRLAGDTHYPLSKLLSLAIEGITSLSVKPITFIALSGIIAGLIGLAWIIWALIAALSGHSVDGWADRKSVV